MRAMASSAGRRSPGPGGWRPHGSPPISPAGPEPRRRGPAGAGRRHPDGARHRRPDRWRGMARHPRGPPARRGRDDRWRPRAVQAARGARPPGPPASSGRDRARRAHGSGSGGSAAGDPPPGRASRRDVPGGASLPGEHAGGRTAPDRAGRRRCPGERLAAGVRDAGHDEPAVRRANGPPDRSPIRLAVLQRPARPSSPDRWRTWARHPRRDGPARRRTWRGRRRRWRARPPSTGRDRGSAGASARPRAPPRAPRREAAASRSSGRSRARSSPAPAGAARGSATRFRTRGRGDPPDGGAASPLSFIAARCPAGRWIGIACDVASASRRAVNRRRSPASLGRDRAASGMPERGGTSAMQQPRMRREGGSIPLRAASGCAAGPAGRSLPGASPSARPSGRSRPPSPTATRSGGPAGLPVEGPPAGRASPDARRTGTRAGRPARCPAGHRAAMSREGDDPDRAAAAPAEDAHAALGRIPLERPPGPGRRRRGPAPHVGHAVRVGPRTDGGRDPRPAGPERSTGPGSDGPASRDRRPRGFAAGARPRRRSRPCRERASDRAGARSSPRGRSTIRTGGKPGDSTAGSSATAPTQAGHASRDHAKAGFASTSPLARDPPDRHARVRPGIARVPPTLQSPRSRRFDTLNPDHVHDPQADTIGGQTPTSEPQARTVGAGGAPAPRLSADRLDHAGRAASPRRPARRDRRARRGPARSDRRGRATERAARDHRDAERADDTPRSCHRRRTRLRRQRRARASHTRRRGARAGPAPQGRCGAGRRPDAHRMDRGGAHPHVAARRPPAAARPCRCRDRGDGGTP